jgi:hypothetical protein
LPIKKVQPIGCGGEEIPDAERIKQNRRGIDLLSVGPENGANDRGDSDVSALLPEESSQRWDVHMHTTRVSESLLSYPIIL